MTKIEIYPDQERLAVQAVNKFRAAAKRAEKLPTIQERREVEVTLTLQELNIIAQAASMLFQQNGYTLPSMDIIAL